MALNLYGNRELGIGAGVAGGAMQSGTSKLGAGLKGKVQSKLLSRQKDIKGAIDAWGMDTILQMQKGDRQMFESVQEDLKQMRRKASEARQANDVETYKLALQQSLHDRQMLTYADQLNKAKIGDIFTGLISALGNIGLIGYDKGWFE
jgi:hypothetical protein